MAIEGEDGAGAAGGADGFFGDAGTGGDDKAGATGAGADGGTNDGEGGADGSGGADPDWYDKLSAEGGDAENPSNREWAKKAGLKDIDGLVKALRDNQKAARAPGKIAIPGENAKPEEIAAYRAAIGVPETVDGYEFTPPEGVEADQLNKPLIDRLKTSALENGVPASGFQGLVQDFIKAQLEEASAVTARHDDEVKAKLKEWGPNANAKRQDVEVAAKALGLSRDEQIAMRQALGPARVLDMMAKIGGGIGEDELFTGGKGRFGVTKASAEAEIAAIKGDPVKAAAAMKPGTPENARWNTLQSALGDAIDRESKQAA